MGDFIASHDVAEDRLYTQHLTFTKNLPTRKRLEDGKHAVLYLFGYKRNVGWGWGFGVPAVAMNIAIIFFFFGSKWYRLHVPGGSPLTRICQVIVAACRKAGKLGNKRQIISLLYETADAESNIKGCRKLEHTNTLSSFPNSVWGSWCVLPGSPDRGHLDHFFWLLTLLSLLDFLVYLCISKRYTYRNGTRILDQMLG
ncbi:hypothetical protein Fmac_012284 [Flemingia macrophylla]|uniref:Uncharacterized protein n=1 Tax=Flemingia macrophylla TaxID=520843 RepID=A0ABD1MPX1_9FABA